VSGRDRLQVGATQAPRTRRAPLSLYIASFLFSFGALSCRASREGAAREPGQPDSRDASSSIALASAEPSPHKQPRAVARPILANDVLLIGDSYVEIPDRALNAELSRLAREAHMIGATESFRDNAISGTRLVGGDRPIPGQYADAQRQGRARLLILDGGGNDIVAADCADCAALSSAVAAATTLFLEIAADRSVERIVYFFYPDLPKFPAFRADAANFMRPRLQSLCESSPVPCSFLDLRPIFSGHPELIGPDHLHPTAAGADAMARALFELLQVKAAAM
jgi:lysophospholipase L1-like esterase